MNKNIFLFLFVLLALGIVGFVLMDSPKSSQALSIQEQSGVIRTEPFISYQNTDNQKKSRSSSSPSSASSSIAIITDKTVSSFTSHVSTTTKATLTQKSLSKKKDSSVELEPRKELPVMDKSYRSFYSKKAKDIKRLKEELPPPPPLP